MWVLLMVNCYILGAVTFEMTTLCPQSVFTCFAFVIKISNYIPIQRYMTILVTEV